MFLRKLDSSVDFYYRAQTLDVGLKCSTKTFVMQQEFVEHEKLNAVGNKQGVLLYSQVKRLITVTLSLMLYMLQ